MRYVILFAIKMYWICIPMQRRRKCIFKESCSTIVFRTAREAGFWKAIQIFAKRKNTCKPNYELLIGGNFSGIVLNDSTKIPVEELSEVVQMEIDFYKRKIANT
jgi:uncharacterized protein